MSIKQRIYSSFFLLVLLFVANGTASLIALSNNRKLSENVSKIINPSLQSLGDFESLLIASKMYTTNWVFLRLNQEDKDALKRLHTIDYPALKIKLNGLSAKWDNKYMVDSLHKLYNGFEKLFVVEKRIMSSLQKFEDYDDPLAKLESEMLIEDELLPRTSSLISTLSGITSFEINIRDQKNNELEKTLLHLRVLISFLAITIILIGIFLSLYMARVIISPINKIRHIVNELGKGITRKVNHKINSDEIGEMVRSVNNLSEKLQCTAVFATEIGNRNFDSYFKPLGAADTLGKALVTMRDNLKTSDESLNESQHIAKLGSWEWNLVTNKLFWSDEVYNTFDVDSTTFSPSYDSYLGFIHPEDREHTLGVISKCLEDHVPFSYECRIISYKKVTKVLLAQGKITKNDKGELIKLTGIGQDITERKKAEKKLEDVNRELNILFNSINEIFFSVNMITLKVIQISATCDKVYGYKQSEFLDNYRLWFDIIHPDDKHIIENEDEIMQRGEQINNQYRIIRKDKNIRWVETKITPTLDKEGKLTRVDGVTRDITERKLAEEELFEVSQRLQLATRAAKVGIWDFDVVSNKLLWDEEMFRLYGVVDAKFSGAYEAWEAGLHPDDLLRGHEEVQMAISGEKEFDTEFRVVWPDKSTHYIKASASVQRDESGKALRMIGTNWDITERKIAEERLIKEKGLSDSIINSLPGIFYLFDQNQKLLRYNKNLLKISGYTEDEIRDKKPYDFISAGDRPQAVKTIAKLITEGVGNVEADFLTKDNKKIPYFFSGIMVNYEGMYCGLGTGIDISARKNAEEELEKSFSVLEATIESTADGILVADFNGKMVRFNKKFVEITGIPQEILDSGDDEKAMGFVLDQLVNPEEFISKVKELYGQNTGVSLDIVKFKDERIIERYSQPQLINGNCIGRVWSFRDITERTKAEAELHNSEERYRQIVETAQEGIWMINEDSNTTFINKKMCEIIEYSAEEIMGKKIHSFMDEDGNKSAEEQIEIRKQGISETRDAKFITKDGKKVWTSLSTNPVFDDDGIYRGALAMITDITKRKYDEELLQKSQASLELNNRELEQKNKELEQFAYVASHDLQEPLRTTISFVQIFKQQYFGKLDAKADKYLGYIGQASDRMRVLIKDLLDFSRIGHNKDMEHVDSNVILGDVIADIDKAIKDSRTEITIEYLPVISGYPTELKQLFQNLILNSIKFRQKNIIPKVNISAERMNDYWQFAFTDNGIGIDKEHNERIFIIFQRLHTRSEYEGSGIGLSHCKKIVELHHGQIWVESIPGQGSTFYFTIRLPKIKINESKIELHNVN